MNSRRPHIIIFNPDEMRADGMRHLGNQAAVTPNLDKLTAEDGVSFKDAFCQNPVCTPSRASFMSGWYLHTRGHRSMSYMLQPDEPVLLKTLKDSGYHVWWGGKNDLVPGENSFDPYCHERFQVKGEKSYKGRNLQSLRAQADAEKWRGKPGSDSYYSFFAGKLETGGDTVHYDSDWAIVDEAIEQIKNRPADKPLCLFLALSYPHPPYAVEDPWYSMIDRSKLPERISEWQGKSAMLSGLQKKLGMGSWNEERWAELRATYYGMCSRIDHQFGLVMNALRQAGIYNDSVVFFFSDHGDYTGDYGVVEKSQNSFEDVLTRVPLVIKPPKNVPVKPGVRSALTELVDFPATVFDLAGIKPDYTHFGKSLVPLFAEDNPHHRDAVFCEGGRLAGEQHCTETTGNNSEPEGMYYPRVMMHRSENGEHGKAVMCRTHTHKYVLRLYEKDELYDLKKDPGECRNIIDEPESREIALTLRERILKFFLETGDVVPFKTNKR
ncbi:MAG: arylsulfatase [Spirochaetes bacterium GWF1_41_5]|nr:MAG: arylsulfatase [Spirochaetes bacterium GWF1_41_5]HBE00959.1 arylsulfatase [Spirochaetia bacterium]